MKVVKMYVYVVTPMFGYEDTKWGRAFVCKTAKGAKKCAERLTSRSEIERVWVRQ